MAGKTGVTPWGARYFDSGWIPRSDWTNVHLGNGAAKNVDSNLTHGLNIPSPYLHVQLLLSGDGTDAQTQSVLWLAKDLATSVNESTGVIVDQVDSDTLRVQTGAAGIPVMDASGVASIVDTEDWFYRLIVTEQIRTEEAA